MIIKKFLLIALALSIACAPLLAAEEPLKTRITGESMEIIKGGQQVIFQNGAKVVRGESVLMAEKIVQDKKNNMIEAFKNVRFSGFSASGEKMSGRCAKAKYNMDMNVAEMWGNKAELIFFTKESSGPLKVEAENIKMNQAKDEINASGNVVIVSSSGTAKAQAAYFDQKARVIHLSGTPQPQLLYGAAGSKDRSEYRADRIRLALNSKKIFLEGNVKGKMISAKAENKKQ